MGCIGSRASFSGPYSPEHPFGEQLIGKTRDEMIIKYGPPDRTVTLDGGIKLWYYKITSRGYYHDGGRIHDDCLLRVALKDKRVFAASYQGYNLECERFIDSGYLKNDYSDSRLPTSHK